MLKRNKSIEINSKKQKVSFDEPKEIIIKKEEKEMNSKLLLNFSQFQFDNNLNQDLLMKKYMITIDEFIEIHKKIISTSLPKDLNEELNEKYKNIFFPLINMELINRDYWSFRKLCEINYNDELNQIDILLPMIKMKVKSNTINIDDFDYEFLIRWIDNLETFINIEYLPENIMDINKNIRFFISSKNISSNENDNIRIPSKMEYDEFKSSKYFDSEIRFEDFFQICDYLQLESNESWKNSLNNYFEIIASNFEKVKTNLFRKTIKNNTFILYISFESVLYKNFINENEQEEILNHYYTLMKLWKNNWKINSFDIENPEIQIKIIKKSPYSQSLFCISNISIN
jgi:hypothetical protein